MKTVGYESSTKINENLSQSTKQETKLVEYDQPRRNTIKGKDLIKW